MLKYLLIFLVTFTACFTKNEATDNINKEEAAKSFFYSVQKRDIAAIKKFIPDGNVIKQIIQKRSDHGKEIDTLDAIQIYNEYYEKADSLIESYLKPESDLEWKIDSIEFIHREDTMWPNLKLWFVNYRISSNSSTQSTFLIRLDSCELGWYILDYRTFGMIKYVKN